MIDRSYLPFCSAREYQDVKMQKWMGFFLSEHTSALADDTNKVAYLSELSLDKKLLFLNQLYTSQLVSHIQVLENNRPISYIGTIANLTKGAADIKTASGYVRIKLDYITKIELAEELTGYESA